MRLIDLFARWRDNLMMIAANTLAVFLVMATELFSGYLNSYLTDEVKNLGIGLNCLVSVRNELRDSELLAAGIRDGVMVREKIYGDFLIIGTDDLKMLFGLNIQLADGEVLIGQHVSDYFQCFGSGGILVNGTEWQVKDILRGGGNIYYDLDDCLIVNRETVAGEYTQKVYFSQYDPDYGVLLDQQLGKDGYSILETGAAADSITRITRTIKTVLRILSGCSLIIALGGLSDHMLGSLGKRTREIGIRRTLGASQRDIFRQFLSESLADLLAALLIASLLMKLIIAVSGWEAAGISWTTVLLISVTGAAFGVYPAYRASHISPVQAIRNR